METITGIVSIVGPDGKALPLSSSNPLPTSGDTSVSNASVATLAAAIGAAVATALIAVTLTVKPRATSSVALTTSSSITTVSVQVVAANSNRQGFFLWNNSANSAYCCLAASCSSANPAMIIATFTSWVWNAPTAYTGPISCIRNSGSGAVSITELL